VNFIHKSTGLKFAELYPKRRYFIARWKEADDWEMTNVRTLDEFQKILDEKIEKSVELVKEK
jgi:hypothetical protein